MKKFSFFILLFLILTGCSSDYELNINNSGVDEKVHFDMSKIDSDNIFEIGDILQLDVDGDNDNDISNHIMDTIKNGNMYTNYDLDDSFFEREVDGSKLSLIHRYENGSFETANFFNSCFGETYYAETDDYYVINGYNSFKCNFKNKIKISIKSDYKVISNNADFVYGNEYIWYFTKKNSEDHELYIQVSKNIKANNKFHWGLLILGLLILGWILYKIRIFKGRDISNDV